MTTSLLDTASNVAEAKGWTVHQSTADENLRTVKIPTRHRDIELVLLWLKDQKRLDLQQYLHLNFLVYGIFEDELHRLLNRMNRLTGLGSWFHYVDETDNLSTIAWAHPLYTDHARFNECDLERLYRDCIAMFETYTPVLNLFLGTKPKLRANGAGHIVSIRAGCSAEEALAVASKPPGPSGRA